MLLSVMTITYNHEPYIAQAIESFLAQKTTFDVEIVIGEDRSTDNTLQICLDYQKKYPGKIRVLSRDTNIGMMANMIDTFSQCKGKYVAVCEGDDYWTDPYKLQKQIDFLEKNEEYAICCHNVSCLVNNKIQSNTQWDTPEETDLQYLLRKGNYITTLSVVYRRNLDMLSFIQRFSDAPFGDYILHLSAAFHGKIKFMKERMAIYRAHSGGVWSMLGVEKGIIKTLLLLEMIHDRVDEKYKSDLKIQLVGWLESIVRNKEMASLFENEDVKRILKNMSMPLFIIEYLKFNLQQRSHSSYYAKYIPLTLLMRAVKTKLVSKIVWKLKK